MDLSVFVFIFLVLEPKHFIVVNMTFKYLTGSVVFSTSETEHNNFLKKKKKKEI